MPIAAVLLTLVLCYLFGSISIARLAARILAPAVSEATKMLLREGCITPYPIDASNLFRTTRKGKALVQLLCSVEIPREVYVDGGGNIIEETEHQQTTP